MKSLLNDITKCNIKDALFEGVYNPILKISGKNLVRIER